MTPAANHRAVTMRDVLRARQRTAATIRRTPMAASSSLEKILGAPVFLKLEHCQVTGSFKLRGAANAVLSLSDADKERGVVGVSTGNYGRALAHAARQAGVRCIICMSRLVPANKVEAVRALGAEVRILGESQDEAQEEVDRLVAEEHMIMLPPFDHPDVIAGQGTLGLETMEDCPEAGTLLVPLSGGGLAAGVALAAKTLALNIRVVGVSMERGAAMHASLQAGKPVQVREYPSLADSLGGGVGLDNQYTFAMVRDLLDDVVLLSETEIAAGVRHIYWKEGEIVEGAAAVGVAAILAGKVKATAGAPVVALLSGRNIDHALHYRIISGEDVDLAAE